MTVRALFSSMSIMSCTSNLTYSPHFLTHNTSTILSKNPEVVVQSGKEELGRGQLI